MKLKKVGMVVLAFTLAVFSLGALSACGPSPEEAIREAITNEFDAFKNGDESAIQQVAQSAADQNISEYGIDEEEFAALVLDGFDYTIDSIEVDGSNAKANLTIISKSSSAFEEQLTNAIDEIMANPDLASMSEDELMQLLTDAITNSLDNLDVVSENVVIEYSKTNNVWTPTNSASALGSLDSVVFAQ